MKTRITIFILASALVWLGIASADHRFDPEDGSPGGDHGATSPPSVAWRFMSLHELAHGVLQIGHTTGRARNNEPVSEHQGAQPGEPNPFHHARLAKPSKLTIYTPLIGKVVKVGTKGSGPSGGYYNTVMFDLPWEAHPRE